MVFWEETFPFVRNLFSRMLEKKLVGFSLSEDWRLLTSHYSFKIFSLGVPEEDLDISGGEGPLICRKRISLIASFSSSKFSRFQHIISMIQKGWNLYSLSCATRWIQVLVLWNWFPSSNSWNSEIILLVFNQKECRTFSNMYVIFKVPLRAQLAVWGCPALPRCCNLCVLQGLCKKHPGLQSSKQILTLAGTWWYSLPIPSLFFSSTGGWWWRCWSPQVCTYC